MSVKYSFLGTGTSQGVPVIGCTCNVCSSNNTKDQRLRSSLLVQSPEITLCIDTGPDFRQQMLSAAVKKMDAILFTHEHQDHTAGLDDVRAFNFLQKKAIDIYANDRVQKRLRQQFAYIFNNPDYPGIPQINFCGISEKSFYLNDLTITPILAMHGQLPVHGFRMGDFTYITDVNFIDEENLDKIRGSKVLVLNALKQKSHHSHFSLHEAVELAQALDVEQTYLTHLSHQMGLHTEVEKLLPAGVNIAYDGLTVEL